MKRRPGDVGLNLRTGISDHLPTRSCMCEMGGLSWPSDLSPLEDLDRVAGLKLDDRLLPAGARPLGHPAPLRLRLHLDDVDALDRHAEQLLDGLANLGLVRLRMDAE